MNGQKNTPEEIVAKLRQVMTLQQTEHLTTVEALRRLSFSECTYYRWKRKYGAMTSEQARYLKALEEQNMKLRRLLAKATQHRKRLEAKLSGLAFEHTR